MMRRPVATAKVSAKKVDDTAIEQIELLCSQEFTKDAKIRIMPDVHAGKGCIIGFTLTSAKWFFPILSALISAAVCFALNLSNYELACIIAGSLLKLEEKIKLHTLVIKKKWMTRKRTIRMNRNNTCCFTGHRPEIITVTETRVYEWLKTQVEEAASNGYVNFISGMRRGVDIYAA